MLCWVFSCIIRGAAFADYTVAAGSTVNASTITNQSGVLTVNGTLNVSVNTSLPGFTSVIINAPGGQIFWTNNSDLSFAAGISITVNPNAPGLEPTIGNGNASQRLIVGTTIVSVSSDNANNASFSFEEFNGLGGLPRFSISSNSPVCNGALALTITPDKTSATYYRYNWSINPGSGSFSANNTSSMSTASTTITPGAGNYTITCTVSANGNVFSTNYIPVVVSALPAKPSGIVASPASICAPASATLTSTSAGNTIHWYTSAVGGTSIASGASGSPLTVNPASTTSYYAEAINAAGCVSAARTAAATITVNTQPQLSGPTTVCAGSAIQLTGTGSPAASNAWVSNTTGAATVSNTGVVTGVSAGTALITYTNSTGCSATQLITVHAAPIVTASTNICVGSAMQLVASDIPAASIPWTSSAPVVATISNTGMLTAVSSGTSSIAYTNVNGCSKSININVHSLPAISGAASICKDAFTQLSGSGIASSTSPWISSNPIIAVVNNSGLLSGTSFGTSIISYTDNNGCVASKTFTVKDLPVVSGNTALCAGSNIQLTGADIDAGSNAWVSENTTVATVSNSGLVTGVSAGTGNITYTNQDGCNISVPVTVGAIPSILPAATAATVCKSENAQYSGLTYTATNAPTTYNLTWNSQAENIFDAVTNGTLNGGSIMINVPANTNAGTYTGNLSVQTSGGCNSASVKTFTLTVNDPAAITSQPVGSPVCTGSNATITATASGTGATSRWELSSNNGASWEDVPNTPQYSGITSNTLQVNNPGDETITNLYRLRVSTTGYCGNTVWSESTQFAFRNVWRGNISTDWNNAANWSNGAVPTMDCADVYIVPRPYQPRLSIGNVSIHNLIIYQGAALTVANAVMSITGKITNNGVFNAADGTLNFSGSSLQIIAGSYFTNNTLKNLTINNPVGVSVVSNNSQDSLNITGALAFGNVNNSTLYTGDQVVLVSNAAGTARVADITNNGVNSGNRFNGKVSVQRYYPSRRSWRLATAPLSGAGSIFSTWQNGGNYRPGTGTYVTGPGATNPTGSNGLDWSLQANISLKIGAELTPVLNTRTSFLSRNLADTSDNIPFFIFVRGDREFANTTAGISNATTVSGKGKLQTGRQTFSATPVSNANTLIGNPYASPVDFDKLVRNNINKRLYVWDPYLNSEVGGYILIDDTDNDGVYSATPASPGGLNQVIQSGQAFFVQTISNGPASIVFQETAKSSAGTNLTAFKSATRVSSLSVNLDQKAVGGPSILLDGFMVQFDDKFDNRNDLDDAIKFTNTKETMAIEKEGEFFALEKRSAIKLADTVFIHLSKTNERSYTLSFVPTNLDTTLAAFLEDSYTGNKTPISLFQQSSYSFTITGEAGSAAPDRFKVVFRRKQKLFSFDKFDASESGGNIALEWKVKNEVIGNEYEVEKSSDGNSFRKMKSIVSTGQDLANNQYQWLDQSPFNGSNFYRIRYKDGEGKYQYSPVVQVVITNSLPAILIYPNPVVNGIVKIAFNNMKAGIYTLELRSTVGKKVFVKTLQHIGGTSVENLYLGQKLAQGIYYLDVIGSDKLAYKYKLVLN